MENTQKTHFIAYKLPIGLLMILAIFGIGHSVRIPHNMPTGTINTVGICYYASAKQVFDAALYSLGSSIDPMLQLESKDDLFGAYLATRTDGTEFQGVPSIRADAFIKEWVERDPEYYKKPYLLKKVRAQDGSVTVTELFPDEVGNGSSGFPDKVIDSLLESFHMRCEKVGQLDPFTMATLSGKSSKESQGFSMLTYQLPGDQNSKQELNTAYLQGTNIKYSGKILRAPQILTLVPEGMEQHSIPLYITLHDNKKDVAQYRLLGATYGLPIIDSKKGFVGNHAIAIVRYDNRWYLCDNHEIVPFESEAAAVKWIDTESRISYEGSNIPNASCKGTAPSAIMYELVSKGTESKGNIKS